MSYNYRDAGITHRQFNHWVKKGYIPGLSTGVGTGNTHKMDSKQLNHARQMGRLVELGMTPEGAYNAVVKGIGHDVIWALEGKNKVYGGTDA